MSVKTLVREMRLGKKSPSEVLSSFIKQIEEKEDKIHAFITLFMEEAREEARKLEKETPEERAGKLRGIPVVVKDNIMVEGKRCTSASRILENYVATYDATVVERLKKEKAVIIGKSNMDEFAMGSSTENSFFGPTLNPHDTARVPGGSSGGSAAAVAAGFAPLALGSDTGGSIRQPASFCGVFGIKPTYGLVSRYGLAAFASSLDQIGPFARNTEDLALLLEVLTGKDEKDSTSLSIPGLNYSEMLGEGDVKKMKLGLPREYFPENLDNEIREKIKSVLLKLERAGASVEEISLPHTPYALSVYYIVAPSEASSNLARFDGVRYGLRSGRGENLIEEYFYTRGEGFGPEVKRRIILGTFALSSGYYDAYYLKAQKVRTLIKMEFEEAFRKVDLIVTPTSPTPAFKTGEKIEDPLTMYLSDIFTIPCNLAGIPGMNVPVGKNSTGLPVGLQVLGPVFSEAKMLRLSMAIENLNIE
ncbi:MAG TPA: Asp-tRNA(Asn)/Glu-tRNA(Gln) amidotransferase subunit GatA [bacterium]|nr:Asp-tRNA(Asn)/Glu-tRNA(Gln) amidotransferase subunit GatA [bacterium]